MNGTPIGTENGINSSQSYTGISLEEASASGPNSEPSINETRPINAYVNYIIKY